MQKKKKKKKYSYKFVYYFFKALFSKISFFFKKNCQNRHKGMFAKNTFKPKIFYKKKVDNQTKPNPNDSILIRFGRLRIFSLTINRTKNIGLTREKN